MNETIPQHYIKKDQWPPKPPDSNPLDYYLWNKVKTKVYEDRLKVSENEKEMISKLKSVWKECAPQTLLKFKKSMNELPSILCAVKECNGNSIKMHFG